MTTKDELPPIRAAYGSLRSFLRKYDAYARGDRFTGSSRADFLLWQERSRKTLAGILGLEKMETAPLLPQRDEVILLEGGLTREHWLIQTEPGVILPFYLLLPQKAAGASPFLCPPGHGGGGKYSVAGLSNYRAVRETIQKYHYDYGLYLARHGFVTLCPDARGFGERREHLSDAAQLPGALLGDCRLLSHMGNPLGIPVAGMQVWDLMRCIDFLSWRGEWDLSGLGCLGFSGGGMQTLFLSALEERVKICVISGYLYGYRDSLLRQNENCSCNYIPHLWEHFDMGDLAQLIAPRPLLVQSCREDAQNGPRGIENVLEQVSIIREAYRLLGAEDRFLHEICPGPHCFHEENLLANLDLITKKS